jgi:signal transduction histidine kinase
MLLVGALGIVVAYGYGMSQRPDVLSALWLPDSVLLCCLLFTPAKRWWIYLAISLPARYYFGTHGGLPGWLVLASFPNDWFKALFSAYLLRRFSRGPFRLDTLRQFLLFLCVAVVASPVLSALGGATTRYLIGKPFWPVWYGWFLSCALVSLVVTPALVHWITLPGEMLRARPRRVVEGLLLSCGLLLTSYAAFGREGASPDVAILYAPIPFLIWSAARFGPIGASSAIAVVGILAMMSTRYGRGPFVVSSPADNVIAMQLFLVVITVPLLLLSIVITERRKAEQSLRQTMGDLARSREHLLENYEHIRNLSAKLLSLHEEERKTISRELHDGVSQQITSLLLSLTILKRQPDLPENARKEMEAVLPLLSQVSDGVRHISRQLHPMVVEQVGLPRALQSLCNDGPLLQGLTVEFRSSELPADLPADSAVALYRIAQEALRNAAYHSRSKRARVELVAEANRVRLRVQDWGCGFDVAGAKRKGGLGLISMQDRAQSLEGTLAITSRAGQGTEIVVEFPLKTAA